MKKKTKILIVDDEPMNIFVFKDIFSNNKLYNCQYADNGEKAIEIFHIFVPDIIILDIMLPGIDGYEVCQKIRQDPKHKFVKIIMVSGKAMLDERLKGYDSGADDYIIKPFEQEELLAKIKVFSRLKYVEEIENSQANLLTLLSHETKTPMSGIMGAVELLMSEDLDPNHIDLLSIVHESTKQLLNFIEKISLYYRLTHDHKIQLENMDILSLINNVLDDLQSKISQKSIQINLQNRNDCNILADFYFLQIAVKNIIENAIKYSKDKGEIQIDIFQESGLCKIIISDQGPGISLEDQSDLFDAFCIKDIKHHHKGLGLSLATSQLILSLHNGCINIDSEPDKGASFCIQLPIYETNK
ncbi:response regulator receiver sensor signal transduction histidine kinase [Candidatus Magnetomorum sp. HK-1]|nr:response regulator receiver sensor signal transduction histidine kinase [Candidatus Magnetomorum sp. HK-1]